MKRLIAILLVLAMMWCIGGCDSGGGSTYIPGFSNSGGGNGPTQPTEQDNTEVDSDESWSIYWYLCGSDLETNFGCATTDLSEMEQVDLPSNVNIIIQTGGAKEWQNDVISSDRIQRWIYNSDGLELLEEHSADNMGDPETLTDFLSFAHENYPAKREGVIFWNHGGGTTGGVAFDENYYYDSLSLTEISESFGEVWGDEKIELVGFDACLMATVDVAAVLEPYANYMVGSQELEPGAGWDYAGWISALAEDPGMDGADLGIAICNTYFDFYEEEDCEDQVTQSVINLQKVGPLLEAYEAFGQEALTEMTENPEFFAQIGREARDSENYGGNTPESGYGNMMDLGHFARKTAWLLPSAQDVLDALEDCVVYNVAGTYRPEATGLSCYYSYSGNVVDFLGYINQGTGTSFKYLYAYGLAQQYLSMFGDYLGQLGIGALPEKETVYTMGWDDHPIYINDDGCAVLDLGEDAFSVLTDINFQFFMFEDDQLVCLGVDDEMYFDWENGVFWDGFMGKWGALDGHIVFMELTQSADDYNLYAVPILIDGEEYILQAAYDFEESQWEILGAMLATDESGMGGKQLRPLEKGDEITTLWQFYDEGDEEWYWEEVETFTIDEDPQFSMERLDEGVYSLFYQMYDGSGNIAYSQPAYFEIVDDTIYTSDEYPD